MEKRFSDIKILLRVILAVSLTLFMIAAFSSCRKKRIVPVNNTFVSGRAIDSITQKGIPGVKVTIVEIIDTPGPGPALRTQQVAVIKTDKNGLFNFSFHANERQTYLVWVDDTVACPTINSYSDIKIGQRNYFTFLMIINKNANLILTDSSKKYNAVTGSSRTNSFTITTLGPAIIKDPHIIPDYINLLHSPDTIQLKIVPYRENIIYLAFFNTYYEDTAEHYHTVPVYNFSFYHNTNSDTSIYLNY